MEICEIFYHLIVNVIFYHSRVKFMKLKEQHANSTRALMSDSNKTCGQL